MNNELIFDYKDLEHRAPFNSFKDIDSVYGITDYDEYVKYFENRYAPAKSHFTVDGKDVTFWIDKVDNSKRMGKGKVLGNITFQTDTGISTFTNIHPLNYCEIINAFINMLKYGNIDRRHICEHDDIISTTEVLRLSDAHDIARMLAKSTDEYLLEMVFGRVHMTIVWDAFIRALVEEGNIAPLRYIPRDLRNALINTFSKWTDDSPSLIVYLIETAPKDNDPTRWEL